MQIAILLTLLVAAWAPAAPSPREPSPTVAGFSFVVIADPHITGRPESDRRLRDAVRWINRNREERKIDLAFVVGDVAWGKGQAVRARGMLEKLEIPWVPLIGDNEVCTGYDREFHLAFSLQARKLERDVDGFEKAPGPVRGPDGRVSYLQNSRLDHKGVRFVALDWVTRAGGDSADLHDYPGGTWEWFTESIETAPAGPAERVVLLSHLPMHRNIVHGVFSKEEMERISEFTRRHAAVVYANYAGHYHFDWWEPQSGYQLFVCDATWDDRNTVRLVNVTQRDGEFRYRQEKVAIPRE